MSEAENPQLLSRGEVTPKDIRALAGPSTPHFALQVRNRIRRRVREAVRLRLDQLNPQCALVINPRRKALDAPLAEIQREVEKLFLRCNAAP